MTFLSDSYTDRVILSLRTGGVIGHALIPIINHSSLKIEGWYATVPEEKQTMVLSSLEVRDIIAKGIVVNDHDAIAPMEDMIRMKSAIDEEFTLIGTSVESESGEKLGKVHDYAVDHQSFYIKKLYVGQNLFKSMLSLTKPHLIIDRAQIIDVTKNKIIVKDTSERVGSSKTAPAQA